MDVTFHYKGGVIGIKDKVPVGFEKNDPVWDDAVLASLISANRANIQANPALNAIDLTGNEMEPQILHRNEQLIHVEGNNPMERNDRRVNLLLQNDIESSRDEAVGYLTRYGIWEDPNETIVID